MIPGFKIPPMEPKQYGTNINDCHTNDGTEPSQLISKGMNDMRLKVESILTVGNNARPPSYSHAKECLTIQP